MRLVECVPNTSHSRRPELHAAAAKAAASVPGVTSLNADPSPETNRTVMTFAGQPSGCEDPLFSVNQSTA